MRLTNAYHRSTEILHSLALNKMFVHFLNNQMKPFFIKNRLAFFLFVMFCAVSCDDSRSEAGEEKIRQDSTIRLDPEWLDASSDIALENVWMCVERSSSENNTKVLWSQAMAQMLFKSYPLDAPSPIAYPYNPTSWEPGKRIFNVQFDDGEAWQQDMVKTHVQPWEEHSSVEFDFSGTSDPDITVSFLYTGSWSYIGKESLRRKPSMNFGWINQYTPEEEIRRIVLHEFGHALGFIHEHQEAGNRIEWNETAVRSYFMKEPNNWNPEQIKANILRKYDQSYSNGKTFDPKSIMAYPIPPEFTRNRVIIPKNMNLSEEDKRRIHNKYPTL